MMKEKERVSIQKIPILISLIFVLCSGVNQLQGQNKSGDSQVKSSAIKLQILLDRAKFSSGEIDGRIGGNVEKALAAFQEAHGLSSTGQADDSTWEALGGAKSDDLMTVYTISPQDVAGPFTANIPQDPMEQAKLPQLSYTSITEELGEKFHCNPQLLKEWNPKSGFRTGETIQVPNVFIENAQPQKTSSRKDVKQDPAQGPVISVSQQNSDVMLRAPNGEILFYAPATVGSERDPLPPGTWKVTVVTKNPVFYYHPELFWDADPSDSKAKIAPGPNNPVGAVWIGTNAPHYGLHGTPAPDMIGHSESHGCIRMTNWDALRLAALIQPGTRVIFQ